MMAAEREVPMRTLAMAVSVALIAGCATTEPTSNEAAPVAAPQSQPQPQARGTSPQAPQARAQQPSMAATARGEAGPGVDVKRSVYFAFDGYDVKPEYRAVVEQNARFLRDNPSAKIVVEGNTDERGSREYNVALGQKRAETVMKMMVVLGARSNQIEAVSYGE